MNNLELSIVVEENFPDWKEFEVYDKAKRKVVLRTKNWQEVLEIYGNQPIPEPQIVFVS